MSFFCFSLQTCQLRISANGRGAWSSKSRYNDYRSDNDLNDVDSEDEEVLHEADENTVSPR